MQIANLKFLYPGSESIPGFKPGARASRFCGRYDEEHPSPAGTVLEFRVHQSSFGNYFRAKDQSGAMQKVAREFRCANALHRADGWTKDTLKPGEQDHHHRSRNNERLE